MAYQISGSSLALKNNKIVVFVVGLNKFKNYTRLRGKLRNERQCVGEHLCLKSVLTKHETKASPTSNTILNFT